MSKRRDVDDEFFVSAGENLETSFSSVPSPSGMIRITGLYKELIAPLRHDPHYRQV